MLRVSLLTLMLLPGVAMADAKFVSPGDQTEGDGSSGEYQNESIVGGRELSASSGESNSSEADETIVYDANGEDYAESEGSYIEASSDDEEDVLFAGTTTGDGEVENIEGGECNPGTTWNAETATCWNDET